MIDDLCADARKVWDRLKPQEREIMDDIAAQAVILRRGEWPPYRRPQDGFSRYDTPNLDALVHNSGNRTFGVSASLFSGWRPYLARKPPLAAPVPGLPEKAPPLPPELAGRLP